MYLHQQYSVQELQDFISASITNEKPEISLKSNIHFMEHSVPYLCSVLPSRLDGRLNPSSIKDFLANNSRVNVGDLDNTPVDPKFIAALIRLFSQLPRSYYYVGTQTKDTKYSSATPWFMYAYKSSRGYNYSDWDFTSHPELEPIFLGTAFKDIIKVREYLTRYPELLEHKNLRIAREEALTKKVDGSLLVETSNRLGKVLFNTRYNDIPVFFRQMILQTWVFTPSIRNEYMVTNVFSLDEASKPIIDFAVPIKKSKTLEDFWLDI